MDTIWHGIAAFFKMTFEILPLLGNLPNIFFIIVIFLLLCYWVYYSSKVARDEKENYLSR